MSPAALQLLVRRARRVAYAAVSPRPSPSAVPSPCVSVCRLCADTGWCEGCLRTADEIAQWPSLDAAGHRAIWARVEARAQAQLKTHPSP